jgi:crossover junction endodeoxyribonuclease RuvC
MRVKRKIKDLVAGVDPGKSGAVAFLRVDGSIETIVRMDDTEQDIADQIRRLGRRTVFCLCEKVASRPGQGVHSVFTFGYWYGFICGIFAANRVRRETRTPKQWQTEMKCKSGGDKNVTKQAAQELFPDMKIIHRNADALLIAELARRIALKRKWIS